MLIEKIQAKIRTAAWFQSFNKIICNYKNRINTIIYFNIVITIITSIFLITNSPTIKF